MANTLKPMRDALEELVANIEMRASVFDIFSIIDRKTFLDAKAALAAPQRNCDVGDAADWEKRFGEECDKGHICSDCPVRHAKTRMAIELDKGARCEFVWAQMPYEEGKGETK